MPNYPYTFQLPPLNVQDIPNDGVAGEFLGINGSGVLDWLPVATGGGDMLKADNLSGLTNYATARTNIGLGTASTPTFANLTLTSPSLSSSAPVTISQTWGNNLATFKALVVNAAGTSGTNSASGSLLLDLQVGGVTQASVNKSGNLTVVGNLAANGGNSFLSGTTLRIGNSNGDINLSGGSLIIPLTTSFGWANTLLVRDGADNTLALRNGAAAQTFNVYGTWSSITDYRRLTISCDNTTGNATITANKGSATTGDVGTVSINGVPVGLGKGNVSTNVAIGTGALANNTSGAFNVAIGNNSLLANSTQSNGIGIGFNALAGGGGTSVGIGSFALSVGGTQSVAIGYAAAQNASNIDSVAIGWASLYATQATHVVALGTNSGRYIANGSTVNAVATNSLFIGGSTKALDTAQTNQIVIGYDATGIGSNSVVLGNDSITKTALKGNVGIGTTSPTSKLHVALNPATNFTTETVKFGNIHFGNGTGDYSNIWIGSIATPLTLTSENFTLASNGAQTILHATELYFRANGVNRWTLLSDGHLRAAADNTYDIGASGANRPRNVYVGNSLTTGSIAPNSGADLIFNGASTGAAWKITPSGHFHAFADNAYDIGASGANRPRNVYVANNVTVGNTVSTGICDVTAIRLAANGSGCVIRQDSNGIIRLSNNNESDFTRLQFGGATDAAPAIARDGAGIKFTGAAAGSTAWIKVPPVAVGSLPLAATAGAGARAFVNDASAPVFGTAVAGGGAVLVPVYCTGSAWNVG